MERSIGTSHWDAAIAHMVEHPELEWVNVRLYRATEISTTGWDYVVARKDGKLKQVTYFNGEPVKVRDA